MRVLPARFVCLVLLLAACSGQPVLQTTTPAAIKQMEEATTPPEQATIQTPTVTLIPSPTDDVTPIPTKSATPAVTALPTPLAVTNEVTFELVAQEGGKVHSVAVNGNLAYVGVGPRLVVLDVTDARNPQRIVRSEVLPGLVRAVLVNGDTVYVGAGRQLVALDVSRREEIRLLDALELPGAIFHLLLEDALYVGGAVPAGDYEFEATGFLAAVDLAQAGNLRRLDTAALPHAVSGMAQAGDTLYVGLRGRGDKLFVFDLAGPGALSDPGTVPFPVREGVFSLQVVGDTLLLGSSMQLHAFNIEQAGSDPPRLEAVWTVKSPPEQLLPDVDGMVVVDDVIYIVGNIPAGAYVPARVAVTAPEPLTGAVGPPTSPLVARSQNYLFVTEGGVLEIYDISRPGEMDPVTVYEPFPYSFGPLALGPTPSNSALFYLKTDPASPTLYTFRLPGLEPLGYLALEPAAADAEYGQRVALDLAMGENQAYVATADSLYQVDTANLTSPRIVAHHPLSERWLNPQEMVALGNVVYLARTSRVPDGGVRLAAITFGNGDSPQQTGELDGLPGEYLRALEGAGDRLYLATSRSSDEGQDWLHVVDVSGEDMSLLTSLPLPGSPSARLATDETLLAVGVYVDHLQAEQLLLVDVSVPDRPAIVAALTLPGSSGLAPLAIQEDILYVEADLCCHSSFASRLLAVDVSDPAHPRAVGATDFPAAHIAVLGVPGDMIVLGKNYVGLVVLRVHR